MPSPRLKLWCGHDGAREVRSHRLTECTAWTAVVIFCLDKDFLACQIRRMDLEARSLPAGVKAPLLNKLRDYKARPIPSAFSCGGAQE